MGNGKRLTEDGSQLHHGANAGDGPRLPEVLVPDDGFGDALGHGGRRAFLLEDVEDEEAAVELEAQECGFEVLVGRADVVEEGGQEVGRCPGVSQEGGEAEASDGDAWGLLDEKGRWGLDVERAAYRSRRPACYG